MGRIFTIGEMLIDFLPNEQGKGLDDVSSYIKMPGGAPANVAVCKFGDLKLVSKGHIVNAIDTTGAGDSFVGAILYKLDFYGKKISELSEIEIQDMLDFANKVASIVTTKKGAIDSLPTIDQIN